MTWMTGGPRTVEVIERNDRERQELQQLLESLGFHVDAFSALTERPAGPGGCLLWSVDGADPRRHDLDGVLAEIGEGTSVIFLARAPPLPLVVRVLKAGAVDVLGKPVDVAALRRALAEAFERSESDRMHRARILELRQRLEHLTPREQQVCQQLLTGQLNKEVGAELGITERTVKAHRASILRKVDVDSVAELVRLATTLELACQQLAERAAVAGRQILGQPDAPTSLSA